MKISQSPSHRFSNESLLSRLSRRSDDVNTAKQKRQQEDDKNAKQVVEAFFFLGMLSKNTDEFKSLVANSFVSIREAVLLTGIPENALRSAFKNIFKQDNTDTIPLIELADLAGRETVSALIYPWRDSHQSCVKIYIQDYVKDEYQQQFLDLFSTYFGMSRDEAKHHEAVCHVLAGYFRMYPQKQEQSSSSTQHITAPSGRVKVDPEVTQEEAANRLGVATRTIRNWESGKTTPPDNYPGRWSRTSFLMFVADYNSHKILKEDARAKNRAMPGGDMNEYSEGADL